MGRSTLHFELHVPLNFFVSLFKIGPPQLQPAREPKPSSSNEDRGTVTLKPIHVLRSHTSRRRSSAVPLLLRILRSLLFLSRRCRTPELGHGGPSVSSRKMLTPAATPSCCRCRSHMPPYCLRIRWSDGSGTLHGRGSAGTPGLCPLPRTI